MLLNLELTYHRSIKMPVMTRGDRKNEEVRLKKEAEENIKAVEDYLKEQEIKNFDQWVIDTIAAGAEAEKREEEAYKERIKVLPAKCAQHARKPNPVGTRLIVRSSVTPETILFEA
jgi:hypothetical protein